MKFKTKEFEKEHLFFSTSTILKWIELFKKGNYADVVINSLKYITENRWVNIYAFVLMPNHLHLIMKILEGHTIEQVTRDFHKFTAQKILKVMKDFDQTLMKNFIVKKKDRKYQIWQRDSDLRNIYSSKFLLQKANYIHNNPLQPKWQLVERPEDYFYSSAAHYLKGSPFNLFKLTDLRNLL